MIFSADELFGQWTFQPLKNFSANELFNQCNFQPMIFLANELFGQWTFQPLKNFSANELFSQCNFQPMIFLANELFGPWTFQLLNFSANELLCLFSQPLWIISYFFGFIVQNLKLKPAFLTKEMDMAVRVQILDEAFCISHSANTLGKIMNLIIGFLTWNQFPNLIQKCRSCRKLCESKKKWKDNQILSWILLQCWKI